MQLPSPFEVNSSISSRGAEKVGALVSGGLDSLILLGYLLQRGYRVQPLYVRCGLVWESAELAALRRIEAALQGQPVANLVVLEFPVRDLYEAHWSITGQAVPGEDSPPEAVFLPARNACLILKAGVWCLLHDISLLALGVLRTNPFADAQPDFFGYLEALLQRSLGKPFRVLTPFASLTKKEVMRLGRDLPLELSFSCIAPRNGLHCGRCNKCAERKEAFALTAIPDPTRYDASGNDPTASPGEIVRW